MKLNTKILAAALLMIGSASSAYAAVVTANGSVVPTFSATAFGGTLVDQASTFINTPSYQGMAQTAVYRDLTTGFLDFYYQFQNDASSTNGVGRLTGFDFTDKGFVFAVDAFQTNAAFGIFAAGITAADTVDRDGLGGVLGANYLVTGNLPTGNGKIDPGQNSLTLIYRTDATKYKLGSFGVINGFAANAAGFAPAVPEPETYAMILVGLGLLGAAKRFKKTKVG
jgi:hypothetical protein